MGLADRLLTQAGSIEVDSSIGSLARGQGACNCLKGGICKKMEKDMKQRVEDYLELFNDIKQSVGDDITARAILAEVSKDRRMDEIRSEKETSNGKPATEKQLAFLKDLGVSFRKGVTKREASELLDEALGKD
jgi:hypothetical protein